MTNRIISNKQLVSFRQYLREEERSKATIEKYLREVQQFQSYLQGTAVAKIKVAQWKEYLIAQNYSPSTINGKLTALDRFFAYCGWEDCQVKHLKLQRKLFRDSNQELTKEEYKRLITTADTLEKNVWLY